MIIDTEAAAASMAAQKEAQNGKSSASNDGAVIVVVAFLRCHQKDLSDSFDSENLWLVIRILTLVTQRSLRRFASLATR